MTALFKGFERYADRKALGDGDIFTPEFLRLFTDAPVDRVGLHSTGGCAWCGPPPTELARPSLAGALTRTAARDWLKRPPPSGEPIAPGEERLLHAFETAAVTRPSAIVRAETVDAELCALYLSLSRRWIAITAATGDPRFLNAALKISAVCVLSGTTSRSVAATAVRDGVEALGQLPVVPRPLAFRGQPDQHWSPHTTGAPGGRQARIAILAGEGSRGVSLFQAAAHAVGIPITGVLLYKLSAQVSPETSYSEAWYPARRLGERTSVPAADTGPSVPTERIARGDWQKAVTRLEDWRIDLLVLLGMEIVPPEVLLASTLGAVNAHNGALPGYRGMDAVGWAVLEGAEPTCTIHRVTPEVDAGDILLARTVPLACADLREFMKATQIAMLVDVCKSLISTGSLPPARRQEGAAKRYYRMHPGLKRLLDIKVAPLAKPTKGSEP